MESPHHQPKLWEHFAVVGLAAGAGLQTVQGEQGFLGTDQKYKPQLVDSLPNAPGEKQAPPPQLPTCCLPAGIDIVLHQDHATASLVPHTFSFVLTEGNGTKVYASCLSFYDAMPHELCSKHEDLLGAKALKAICLLSHRPYLVSTDKVLCELYHIAFVYGSRIPLPEIISSLLTVPSPQLGGPKVCLSLGRSQVLMCPPLAIGPPPGELSLQPLAEVLKPDNIVALFAAVLLEQRVLLRCRQHWLLTHVAEGVVRLLHPLKYQHVYIPVMPYSLTDYLEAPTPFLMGLHSGEVVAPQILEVLVVADLDNDIVTFGKDDGLLQRCLSHPYMLELKNRVRMLLRPSVTDVDAVGQHQDPWVVAAQSAARQPWGPCKQALLIRIFLEFFHSVLGGYHMYLMPGSTDGSRTSTSRSIAGAKEQQQQQQSGLPSSAQGSAIAALAGTGVGGASRTSSVSGQGLSGLAAVHRSAGASSPVLHSPSRVLVRAQSKIDMQALLDHHSSVCRHSDIALLHQIMQGLPFITFAADQEDPGGWLRAAEEALGAWRAAEQELQAAAAGGTTCSSPTEVVSIPQQPAWPLMPAGGLVYRSFPALILMEHGEGLVGLRLRRRTSNSNKKRAMGKRRAISELMGSQIDLRRNSPVQGSLNTQALHLHTSGVNTTPATQAGSGASSATLAGPLAPLSPLQPAALCTMPLLGPGGQVLPSLAQVGQMGQISTTGGAGSSGSGGANGLSLELGEYSAEADLVRRQTGLLVQLMQAACAGPAGAAGIKGVSIGAASSSAAGGGATCSDVLSGEDLEAAKLLLCIQTGGNGWFLVSRLKEIITTGCSSYSSSAEAAGKCSIVSSKPAPLPASAPSSFVSEGGDRVNAASSFSRAPVPSSLPGSSSSSKQSPPKSNKLFDIAGIGNASRGSSSNAKAAIPAGSSKVSQSVEPYTNMLRSASPPGMKVSQSVESFASAASAMASAFSASVLTRRSLSITKGRPANSSSSPGPDPKAVGRNSSNSSPCADHKSSGSSSNSPGADAKASGKEGDSIKSNTPGLQVRGAACDVSSSSNAGEPAGGPTAGRAAAAAEHDAGNARSASSESQPSSSSSAQMPHGCWWERRVGVGAFDVLSEMMTSVIEVAAVQDDFRVALAVLELACVITCQPAFGPKRLLLSTLASTPVVHLEWFWAGAFSFAVSSSYLNAQELASIRDVVVCCLADFTRYITGIGITGTPAWLLLMQLAAEHLKNQAPLEPEVLLNLRAHLAHQDSTAQHERLGVSGPMPQPAIQYADPDAGTLATAHLPEHVVSGLRVCGVDVGPFAAAAADGDADNITEVAPNAVAAMAAVAAGGLWRQLSHTSGSQASRFAALEWKEQGNWGMADADIASGRGSSMSGTSRRSIGSCSRRSLGGAGMPAGSGAPAQPLLAISPGLPSIGAGQSAACSAAPVIPAPVKQPDCQVPAVTSPRQAGAAAPSGPAFPACVTPAAAIPAAVQVQSSDSSSPRGMSPRSGSRLIPRPGSRLSPRDDRPLVSPRGYRHRSSRSSSRSMSRSPSRGYLQSSMYAGAAIPAAGRGTAEAANEAATTAGAGAGVRGGARVEEESESLLQPGVLQWAALHSKPVVAVDASSYTVLSVSLDGTMKVVDTSDGQMRLSASMAIPALQTSSSCSSSSCSAAFASMPVLKLWRDGSRAAVGNARQQSVWVVDLQGLTASVELSGLGSSVSALHLLHRNRDALLAGLSRSSTSCCSQSGAAAGYLWDLRRPKRPAASLDFAAGAAGTAVSPSVAAAASNGTATGAGGGAAAAGVASCDGGSGIGLGTPGVSCLAVHDDGVLAAAGCRDGRALVWDMRKPATPLATCLGHQGPINKVSFVPAAAAAASAASVSAPSGAVPGRLPLLLTGSDDWTARLWDAASGACHAVCVGHGGPVTAVQVACSNACARLVTGAADGTVAVWGLQGELCSLAQQHWAPVQLLAQGLDTLVSGASDKTCHIWSLAHMLSCTLPHLPQQLASQQRHALVSSMAYDPVAELLCSGHRDGLVSVWNCSSNAEGV